MYKLSLELVGEKKPRAKTPFSDMSLSPGKSGFPCVSWSSDRLGSELRSSRRMMRGRRQAMSMRPFLFASEL